MPANGELATVEAGIGAAASQEAEWTEEQQFFDHLAHIDPPRIAILDFDETFWLRNSTEEFLDHVQPRILAVIVLQLLGALKPWRWISPSNPNQSRDWIRVAAVLMVAPWSYFTWRRAARRLGPKHLNTPLLEAVSRAAPQRIGIATFGFSFIVAPLVRSIGGAELLLSASLLDGTALRRTGKAQELQKILSAEELESTLFVSDSLIDHDAKGVCKHAYYVRWPAAEFRQACRRPLLPLAYTSRVKRPNERYILHGIIGYDFAVAFLSYGLAAPNILATTATLALYLLGFFAVYEIGYYENDTAAQKHETKPILSETFQELGSHFSPAWAWAFGLLFTAAGAWVQAVMLTAPGSQPLWATFASHWLLAIALLVGTRLTFRWFNSIKPRARILPMMILQLQRTLGYALMLPISWPGALLCVCHAIGRWFPYAIYRFGGERHEFPSHLFAFLLFLCGAGVVTLALRASIAANDQVQLLIIAAYMALRAARSASRFWSGNLGAAKA